jgi:predicted NUDIX family phosphoesterase
LSAAVKKTARDYGPNFGGIIEHETSGKEVRESSILLAGQILDRLEAFLDPQILVVPRRELEKLPLADGGAFTEAARKALQDCISSYGKFMRRAQAESDPDHVQIVACGILTHNDQVFLFERKERDPKYRLYGKATVWQGAHVPIEKGKRGLDLLEAALLDRITRNLFLSRGFAVDFVGYCWDRADENSSRHFGAMFKVNIDNEETAIDLRRKEFRRGRGHGLAGRFIGWSELSKTELQPELETWSLAVLKGLNDIRGLRGAV